MAFTPVPAVIAGDWIDEVFINTYWVDNMAAGVPDVFTAKGQLAVASGVDALGVLSVGANNKVLLADSAQSLGVKWDWNVVLVTSRLTNTGWDGDNKSTGTTIFTANAFNASLPNTARALFMSVSAKWAAASDANFINVKCNGGSGNGIVVRSQVANSFQDNAGLITLDASGQFQITVGGAAADVFLDVWGYIL